MTGAKKDQRTAIRGRDGKHSHPYDSKNTIGPRCDNICLRGFAIKTGPDQPAHLRSLISAFIVRFLKSIICNLATGEILIF